MATALRPRNEDRVTSWPNWSRRVKWGAGPPIDSPTAVRSEEVPLMVGTIVSLAPDVPGAGGSLPFCELPLEHLAGGVAGQLVEEDDLAGHLEAGEVLLDPVLQVVLRRVTRDHHERLQALAEVVVVDADRGHLDDRL